MTTDIYRQQLIVDGAEAVAADVNSSQRFLGSRLSDQILGQLIIGQGIVNQSDYEFPGQRGSDPPTSPYAIAIHPGVAFPRQGSTNNKVQIAAGTLLQKVRSADGLEESILAYTFLGTEEVAIANGDATNPRVDLVQMKLELLEGDSVSVTFDNATPPAVNLVAQNVNTTRRVKCALSIKVGVPAASPFYPDPDAGFVAIAGVVVGANYVAAAGLKYFDTAGAVAVLHDQRLPMCVRGRSVTPRQMEYVQAHLDIRQIQVGDALATATGPTLAADGTSWALGTTVGRLIYPAKVSLGDRITGWDVRVRKGSASGTITAQLYKKNVVTLTETALGVASTNNANNPGFITLSGSGMSEDVSSVENFYVVLSGGGVAVDNSYHASVTVMSGGANASAGWDDSFGSVAGNVADGCVLVAMNAGSPLRVPCPAGQIGRVMMIALASKGVGNSADAYLSQKQLDATGMETITNCLDVAQVADIGANGFHRRNLPLDGNVVIHHPPAGPTVRSSATFGISVPMWTSGMRVPYEEVRLEAQATPFFILHKSVVLNLLAPAGALVGPATWFVAEGL